MKRTDRKKLALNRTTLRNLSQSQLGRARGGVVGWTGTGPEDNDCVSYDSCSSDPQSLLEQCKTAK